MRLRRNIGDIFKTDVQTVIGHYFGKCYIMFKDMTQQFKDKLNRVYLYT